MTMLTIELPDEQKTVLAAKAHANGLSAEQYAQQVLERDLAPEWLRKSCGSIQLCISGSVYAEYEEVIKRPRFQRSDDVIAGTLQGKCE